MSPFMEVGVVPPIPHVLSGSRSCQLHCSSDGRRIVYGTMSGVVSRCLPDQLDSKTKVVEVFVGNQSAIEVGAISPDGLFVVGGDKNGTLYVWAKGQTGVSMTTYQLGIPYVRIADLSFSEDSKHLAIVGLSKHSQTFGAVIALSNGEMVGTLDGHQYGINSVTFRSKKPSMVATAGVDGLICYHSGPQFKLTQERRGHRGQVFSIRFSPDGENLVSCGEDGRLILWDVKEGLIDRSVDISVSPLYGLAWSADSSRIITVGADRKLRILEAAPGTVVHEVLLGADCTDTPIGVVWTPTDWVCAICGNGRIWGYKTEQQRKFLLDQQFLWHGMTDSPTAIASNTTSGRMVVGDASGTLLFLGIKESDPLTYHLLKLPSTEAINSIIIGKELGAAVTADGIIRIFRFPKEKLTSVAIKAIDTELQHVEDTTKPIKPANNHSTFVRSILHLVDGETALDSTGIGTLGATCEVPWVATHRFEDAPVAAIAIDNDQAIVVACSSGMLYAYPFSWAPSKFHPLWNFKTYGTITAASASSDGTLVAIGIVANATYPLERFGDGRTSLGPSPYLIEMYEVDSHEEVEGFRLASVYELHTAEITCIALNSSGTYIASADTTQAIFVVEIETGKVGLPSESFTLALYYVFFHHQKVVTNQWKQHSGTITNLSWSLDGKKLASGSVDKDIYIWDLDVLGNFIQIKDVHQGNSACLQFIFNNTLITVGKGGSLVVYELELDSAKQATSPRRDGNTDEI